MRSAISRKNQFVARPRGFTLIELLLGLVVTILVVGALGAFSLAVANRWTESEEAQAVQISASQGALRLEQIIRKSIAFRSCIPGSLDNSTAPAALFLWMHDSNRSEMMEASELALLEHDPSTMSIMLYVREFPTAAERDAADAAPWAWNTITPAEYKVLPHVVGRRQAVRVVGARFAVTNAEWGKLPTLEYVLRVRNPDGRRRSAAATETIYGTAVMRAPAK